MMKNFTLLLNPAFTKARMLKRVANKDQTSDEIKE
jgi:hypothetical protein